MLEMKCDVAIIGGGPAGLSAAVAAKKEGADKVLIIERDNALGGILQQCIHPGFGLNYFKAELTGPEYAGKFAEEAKALGVECILNAMIINMLPVEKSAICVNEEHGVVNIKAGSIVLAMGCRERTRANIVIPGTRPAGVYTAGAAQRLINRQNEMVGEKIVILGSGDIGMIMARRMTLEGAKVVAVIEIMDYLAGLTRNRVQCLDDFGIPLKLSHTITKIVGNERVIGVYVAQVDNKKQPIKETEEYIDCDTVLLSVGLLPENELTKKAGIEVNPITNGPIVNQYMQTASEAVFACGNVVHVNDLVDNVTIESMKAGKYAAQYVMKTRVEAIREVSSITGDNVRYICPQKIVITKENEKVRLYFRVLTPEFNVVITVSSNGVEIAKKKAKRVNPGEIEFIEIDTVKVQGEEVTVSVNKQGGAGLCAKK